MRKKKSLKTILYLLLYVALPGKIMADTVPLEKLLLGKSVVSDVKVRDHFGAFRVNVGFTNLTDDTLDFNLESGRIFNSVDPKLQDLVTVHQLHFVLLPHGRKDSMIYAFCKDKSKRGPTWESELELGPMSKGKILKVCRFLENKDYNLNTVQHAVWVASDSIPVSSVFSREDDRTRIEVLRTFLTDMQNGSHTSYMIEYRSNGPDPSDQVPVYMVLDDEYVVKKEGVVRIVFTDSNGAIVRELLAPTKRPADKFNLHVRMYLDGLISGTYFVRVFRDQYQQREWQIEL